MISINFNEENKKVLIVGGGKQAITKAEKFSNVTYLSPSFIDEVPEEKRILKTYEASDVNGYFLVIAATNNKELNHEIVMDCNERNILCANINSDDDASVHFQKEMDYPFLHLAFTTKGACPGYHTILEKDFNSLYEKHEIILQDLQVIRERALETIHKYSTRNEFITNLVEKDPRYIHELAKAVEKKYCKVLAFHSHINEENIQILSDFTKEFEVPCLFGFIDNIDEILSTLKELDVYADYYPITIRPGHSLNKMITTFEGHSVHPITFTDKELSKMMREAHYAIYIYHPVKNDTLKNRLARSYVVADYNDELPDAEVSACVCLLLKAGHFQNEIADLQNKYPNIQFNQKCLFEQEFFKKMLLEKLG